jgi:hypothetical protein
VVNPSGICSQATRAYLLQSQPLKAGDKETIIYKLEASAIIEIPSMPNHPAIPLYSRLEQEIEQKILKLSEGHINRLERHYCSSKYYLSKSSKTPKPEPLDGKRFIIEEDGTITPTDAIPLEIQQFISMDEHRFSLILPSEEVRLKSEWALASDVIKRVFNFSNHKKRSVVHGCTEIGINARFSDGSGTAVLKEVKTTTGQESAVIEMTVNLKGDDNGLGIDANLKGPCIFALKKGRFTKVELAGEMLLDGEQPCTSGVQGRVTGRGKIALTYEFK